MVSESMADGLLIFDHGFCVMEEIWTRHPGGGLSLLGLAETGRGWRIYVKDGFSAYMPITWMESTQAGTPLGGLTRTLECGVQSPGIGARNGGWLLMDCIPVGAPHTHGLCRSLMKTGYTAFSFLPYPVGPASRGGD